MEDKGGNKLSAKTVLSCGLALLMFSCCWAG